MCQRKHCSSASLVIWCEIYCGGMRQDVFFTPNVRVSNPITYFRHYFPCTPFVKDVISWCVHVVGICCWYLNVIFRLSQIFPLIQLDTEYRKKWDALVIKLEVVDRDVNTGTEVVHWATHFPVSSESSSPLPAVIT